MDLFNSMAMNLFQFDVCHILKLDPDGNKIKWKYITSLHNIQEEEGLKFANKLSNQKDMSNSKDIK